MGDNLKQAFKEIFSSKREDNGGVQSSTKKIANLRPVAPADPAPDVKKPIPQEQSDTKKENAMQSSATAVRSAQKNVISAGTKILGSILAESDLEINGQIEGDVESSGYINVTGNVLGKITCAAAEIDRAVIEGDISAAEELTIGEGSKVHGTISAKKIRISGEVKGDVSGATDVFITNVANVQGNITTPAITVESGAVLNGKVDIQR